MQNSHFLSFHVLDIAKCRAVYSHEEWILSFDILASLIEIQTVNFQEAFRP